jgi:MerR family transcriptional regulator/heat shock protein HspR
MKYVRLEEAIIRCGLGRDIVAELLADEVIVPRPTLEREKVITKEEAEELRIARTLLDELGVNLEGVEVIIAMRRRQIAMRSELDAIVVALRDELRSRLRDPELFGPAGYLP